MTTKRGRPPKAEKDRRENVLRICLKESERKVIDRAAKESGTETSTWARERLLEIVNRED